MNNCNATASDSVKAYRANTHCPTDDEFVCGDNIYRKVGRTSFKYLYEVTPPSGTSYYEVVERGHLYKCNEGAFRSSVLGEGQEMYPNDNDFGVWGWCYNDKAMAVNSLRWDKRKRRRVPLEECIFADGFNSLG